MVELVAEFGDAFIQTRFWGESPGIGKERVEVTEWPGLSKEGSP